MSNTWREQQLAVFQGNCAEPVVIQQDHDLVDFIINNQYTTALAYGDTEYFSRYVNLVKTGPVNFCIFIVNEPFDFDEIVKKINTAIKYHIVNDGIIYLSINKFLAFPTRYSNDRNVEYDQLIYQYVNENINAEILSYSYVKNDKGSMFNFVHPLTRFYLKV